MSGKTPMTAEGIAAYYSRAISSVPISLPKRYTPNSSFFKKGESKKNYHLLLKTKQNSTEQYRLWHARLRNVCTALNVCLLHFQEKGLSLGIIELSIFGSESVSSDIDIGVSYKRGTNMNDPNTVHLSKVVECFETYFIDHGYTSLDIDVEMYADYLISPTNGLPFIEMNPDMFRIGVPYVLSGVLKNLVQSIYDKSSGCDIRRNTKKSQNYSCFKEKHKNIDNTFKILHDINLASEMNTIITQSSLKPYSQQMLSLLKVVPKYELRAKKILFEYLKLDYHESVVKYYQILDLAHKACVKYATSPSKRALKRLYEHISHALVFRAESYISATTVYHIVYQTQAKPSREESERLSRLIKKHGYHLSFLEQIGYLVRYNNQYSCNIRNCSKEEKLMRKYNKYNKRLISALNNFRDFNQSQKRCPRGRRRRTKKRAK